MKKSTTARAIAILVPALLLVAAVPVGSRLGSTWCNKFPWWPGCRGSSAAEPCRGCGGPEA